jgi:C-methyltransferase
MTIKRRDSEESIGPDRIFEMFHGLWVSGILKAAVELDVFTAIAEGSTTVEAIAAKIEASSRGTRILLNALGALDLVWKRKESYGLEPIADTFLVRGKEAYIGDFSSAVPVAHWEAFGKMAEAVKKGAPVCDFLTHESEDWEQVALALVPLGIPVARSLGDILGIGREGRSGCTILDVACGSGVYGYTLLQQDPRATVTGLDRKNVLKVAARVARDMGVAERVTHRAGDILTMDYGHSEFDIAIVSHILQGFDAAQGRGILEKVYDGLFPGGVVVINDFVADEDRCTRRFPLLFACYMLLVTPEGDTYTFSEFKSWLDAIGFQAATKHEVPGESTLIVANKKGP